MTAVAGIAQLDATAQADLVRRGEVSAREIVEWGIERIEKLNPTLNAVVTPMFDRALARAGTVTGPFAGVPYLLKDLVVEVAGTRFTEGSAFLRDNVSTVDSALVTRLERAGLVILGKTNAPEFGMVPTCEPALHGPTHNPWDVTRSTSGSSGGSAAAVAARTDWTCTTRARRARSSSPSARARSSPRRSPASGCRSGASRASAPSAMSS